MTRSHPVYGFLTDDSDSIHVASFEYFTKEEADRMDLLLPIRQELVWADS